MIKRERSVIGCFPLSVGNRRSGLTIPLFDGIFCFVLGPDVIFSGGEADFSDKSD